jgi:hypothetical protein
MAMTATATRKKLKKSTSLSVLFLDFIEVDRGKFLFGIFGPDSCGPGFVDAEGVADDAGAFPAFFLELFVEVVHGFRSQVAEDDVRVLEVGLEKIVGIDFDFGAVDEILEFGQEERYRSGLVSLGLDGFCFCSFQEQSSVAAAEVVYHFIFFQFGHSDHFMHDVHPGRDVRYAHENTDYGRGKHQKGRDDDDPGQDFKKYLHEFAGCCGYAAEFLYILARKALFL